MILYNEVAANVNLAEQLHKGLPQTETKTFHFYHN